MAGRIIYLEVDDEITSAAARIRAADALRIAVVLPYGSRVATSRINFRLLSRDALEHEKRLSIVSGDPATRALAASAGLPVFASVAEYESSLAGTEDEPRPGTAVPVVGVAVAAAPASLTDAPEIARDDGPGPAADGTLGLLAPAVVAGAAGGAGSAAGAAPLDTIRTTVPPDAGPIPGSRPGVPGGPPPPPATAAAGAWRGGTRTPWLIGGAILALALLVGGVGIYLLLPSATIVVTPRTESVGPIHLTVTADPTATQPDATALVVPANEVSVPVSVNDTFNATGTRVQVTNATGTVQFKNYDPTSSNRIVAGSIVQTQSGIRFRTGATVTVPSAQLIGVTIFPSTASVKVTAVVGGPDGNVAAGTIVVVPSGEIPLFLRVTNLLPTTGGKRQEFKRITQEDVDGALASLDASLHEAFTEALANPSLAVGGVTVFPTTGKLGPTTPTVDPATLVGQEVATFDLGLSATGTVITADTAPVTAIADAQLRSAVKPDHELVAGSVQVTVDDPIVIGQTVTIPVTATAEQVANLDPATLKAMVLGKPVEEAKAILAPYGDTQITVSPDWSGSVPTFESRVDLTVEHAVQIEAPAPSGSSAP